MFVFLKKKNIWKMSLVENSASFLQPASINLTEFGKPGAGGTEAACLTLDRASKSASTSTLIKVAALCLCVCAARAYTVISYVGASTNTCVCRCFHHHYFRTGL